VRYFSHFREHFTQSFISPDVKRKGIRISVNGEVYALNYFEKFV